MGLFEALSYPQRKVKEAISGDEAEWFSPEGMPTWAYAAGNTALDLVADPLNFIPMGLFAKAGKALPKAAQMRGSLLSSAPNYIPNHYGTTDPVRTPQAMTDAVAKILGKDPAIVAGATGKAEGIAQFGLESAANVMKSLSPSGRALYADTGINKGTQATAARHAKKGVMKKAFAQVNYNKHQNVQAGRVGPTGEAMEEIARHSNLETYQPLKTDTISGLMKKHAGTQSTKGVKGSEKAIDMADSEAKYIEDHILTSWGMTDDVVMKRARSGTGGKHFNDFTLKSPMNGVAYNIFKKHKGADPSLREMYEEALKLEKKQPFKHKFYIKNPDWEDVQKNGLWFKGSLPGSAITEGGVNWVGKLDTNGDMLGVISDKHDFLDKPWAALANKVNKIPGASMRPEVTKRSLLAVTPPMRANIKNLKKRPSQLGGTDRVLSGVERKKVTGEASQDQLLQNYITAKPTPETLAAVRAQDAGMLTSGAALYQGREDVQ